MQDGGGESLNMTELLATPGVQLGAYSTPVNPILSYAWGTNTTFATQADARSAFLDAISMVRCRVSKLRQMADTIATCHRKIRPYIDHAFRRWR